MTCIDKVLGINRPTPKRIAEAARRLRTGKDMTQTDLAQRADLSLSTVEQFEATGDISLPAPMQIADALGEIYQFSDLFPKPPPSALDEVDGGPR